jgi:ribosomal protein L16/L10AE
MYCLRQCEVGEIFQVEHSNIEANNAARQRSILQTGRELPGFWVKSCPKPVFTAN